MQRYFSYICDGKQMCRCRSLKVQVEPGISYLQSIVGLIIVTTCLDLKRLYYPYTILIIIQALFTRMYDIEQTTVLQLWHN